MYIHFTTQNFKHDTSDFGYIGNPGLVEAATDTNEIFCGCYLDIDGCYITSEATYEDVYSANFSYHGFVPLVKDSGGNDRLVGVIKETESAVYNLTIQGAGARTTEGFLIGKIIRVAIVVSNK